MDLVSLPSVVEHRRLEMLVVVQEEEGRFEVDDVSGVFEIGKSGRVSQEEFVHLARCVTFGHEIADSTDSYVDELFIEHRWPSTTWPDDRRGRWVGGN